MERNDAQKIVADLQAGRVVQDYSHGGELRMAYRPQEDAEKPFHYYCITVSGSDPSDRDTIDQRMTADELTDYLVRNYSSYAGVAAMYKQG